MCDALAHRGPDEEGFHLDPPAGLGIRRLSIIDPEGGHQPVGNEDGSVWAVLNGEIYNYRSLRSELAARGHRFRTAGDTEVIVHLYEELGGRCVERLRGMFAIGVWDRLRSRLTLARDRLGIKPLYYAEAAHRFIFASELQAILELPEVDRQLNWCAVDRLFTFLTTPLSESIIAGIEKLPPGHLLTAAPGGGTTLEKYWDPVFQPDYSRSADSFAETLRELLEESVRLHRVSDVPVGAFLSGGMDSSAVVALMARQGATRFKTFSVGFSEADYSELEDARRIARQFGTEHHEMVLGPDVSDLIVDLSRFLDEPFGDSSAIPTYAVSALAARHVKVVLSGDGGDELFAGYDKYQVEKRERPFRLLPGLVRRAMGFAARRWPRGVRGGNRLHHLALAGTQRTLDSCTLFRQEEKGKLFREEVLDRLAGHDPSRQEAELLASQDGHWLSALQYVDLKTYLPLDILTKVDRMSMAHSLEARVPLLDHKLVEFAATIPPELLLRGKTGKLLFRRALSGVLPEATLTKAKHGFAVPLGRWLREGLGDFARDLLISERSRRRLIFDPAYVERLLERHRHGEDLSLQLWTLLSFELWCREHLDRVPAAAVRRDASPILCRSESGEADRRTA